MPYCNSDGDLGPIPEAGKSFVGHRLVRVGRYANNDYTGSEPVSKRGWSGLTIEPELLAVSCTLVGVQLPDRASCDVADYQMEVMETVAPYCMHVMQSTMLSGSGLQEVDVAADVWAFYGARMSHEDRQLTGTYVEYYAIKGGMIDLGSIASWPMMSVREDMSSAFEVAATAGEGARAEDDYDAFRSSIIAADASFQADAQVEVVRKLQRMVGSSLGNVTAAAKKGRPLPDFSSLVGAGGREVHPSDYDKTVPDRTTTRKVDDLFL